MKRHIEKFFQFLMLSLSSSVSEAARYDDYVYETSEAIGGSSSRSDAGGWFGIILFLIVVFYALKYGEDGAGMFFIHCLILVPIVIGAAMAYSGNSTGYFLLFLGVIILIKIYSD